MVKALIISPDSKVTEIDIDPGTKKLSEGYVDRYIVSYSNNILLKHAEFEGVKLVARYSRISTNNTNTLASNLLNSNIKGNVVLALKRDGRYINFDSSMLHNIKDIMAKYRVKRQIEKESRNVKR